ncbi:MAG: hypothetical protein AB8G15_12890 [Saprospiraceae bacterium]
MDDQESFKQKIIPILEAKGQFFKKVTRVFAKKAQGGELIETITNDGLETRNTAKSGDFIIKNQTEAAEQYILSPDKFLARYQLYDKKKDGFHEYDAIGKIIAIEVDQNLLTQLNYPPEFHFIAPWGGKMIVKKNDFLASPLDLKSVYRIARKEFFQTYQKIS